MNANTAETNSRMSFADAMRFGLLLLAAASVQAQSIAWSTFLGGTGWDTASAIATDREGNVYVAGASPFFVGAPYSFLAKLDTAGTRLLYVVAVSGIGLPKLAVGEDGSAWVTGAYYDSARKSSDSFVARYSPAGEVVYSTLVGDFNYWADVGIAVDKSGNAFVLSSSKDYKSKVRVTKLDGTGRIAFRYELDQVGFSGAGSVRPPEIALDPDGSIWISGVSFLAKLNASGTALLYSEFDVSGRLLTDPAGNVHFWELQGGSPLLFHSEDSGATWVGHGFRALDWAALSELRFSAGDSPKLYAVARFLDYYYGDTRSSWLGSPDEGRTWSTLWTGWGQLFAPHPTDPKILFAASDEDFDYCRGLSCGPLIKTTDGGSTWERIDWGIFVAIVVDPASPDTLYVSSVPISDGIRVGRNGVVKYGPGEPIVSKFLADPESVRALEASGGAIFALTDRDWIWRTVDGAGTWRPVAWGIRGMRGRPSELFAWSGTALLVSPDRGDSWTWLAEGAFYNVFFDPVSTATLWASTKEGLANSTDGGVTWNVVLPGQIPNSVAVDPKRPSTVYAAFSRPGNFYPDFDRPTTHTVLRRLDGTQLPRPVATSWRLNGSEPVALDAAGNLHFAGNTPYRDMPTSHKIQADYGGGYSDGFLSTFGPDGQVSFATYLGGSQEDAVTAMTIDKDGNVLLAGWTRSPDFPVKNAIQPNYGGNTDVFVTKFAPK